MRHTLWVIALDPPVPALRKTIAKILGATAVVCGLLLTASGQGPCPSPATLQTYLNMRSCTLGAATLSGIQLVSGLGINTNTLMVTTHVSTGINNPNSLTFTMFPTNVPEIYFELIYDITGTGRIPVASQIQLGMQGINNPTRNIPWNGSVSSDLAYRPSGETNDSLDVGSNTGFNVSSLSKNTFGTPVNTLFNFLRVRMSNPATANFSSLTVSYTR